MKAEGAGKTGGLLYLGVLALECGGRRGQEAFELQQRERQSMKSKIQIALAVIAAAFNWQAVAQTYDTNNVVVQTFAGSGFSGNLDGVGQQTMFNNPNAIAADSSSNLFVLDNNSHLIRKITPDGTVSTFAGGGGNPPPSYGTNVALYNF